MQTEYWIYENWTVENKAVIYRSDCSFCNNGIGIHPYKEEGRNGEWHGPFKTYNQARTYAINMIKRPIRNCSKCL